jgi:peptidoglycan/LPS O-acetylase OafA/YrhL
VPSSTHPDYRPDIDGLRAIAVGSVVAYHAFPLAVSGGFVGVDIFFVISGFLISSIILKSLHSGAFSYGDFYSRRVRRIFPALIVVLFASIAFGWFVMLADEFKQLGKHVVGGAAFVSNFVFWDEVDYFDSRAELKPLLHLWSLGVEEQFYILWPLILVMAWRIRSAVPTLIMAIILASFMLNVGTVEQYPAAAFYLPFSRFWELLCGGLIAYFALLKDDPGFGRGAHQRLRAMLDALPSRATASSSWLNHLASIIGAVLVCFAVLKIDRQSDFPGWWALLPTSGALLLIAAGPNAWFNRVVLARKTMVFVGLISYPLYLWHWPLFSFARLVGQASQPLLIGLIIVSIFLAWATYRLVELPVKRRSRDPGNAAKMTRALCLYLAGITLLGFAVWGSLLPGRLDAASRELVLARDDWDYPSDGVVGDPGEGGTVLFFGDSYIRQYYPRIEYLSRSGTWAGKTLLFETEGGCAPYTGIERRSFPCNAWAQAGYELANREDIETIVLGASWIESLDRGDYYRADDSHRVILDLRSPQNDWVFSRIEDNVRGWIAKNKRVYIILANPAGPDADPSGKIGDRLAWTPSVEHRVLSLTEHRKKSAFVHDRLRLIAKDTGATIIDPALWLCEGDVCETETTGGVPMYCDDGHLRGNFVRDKVHYLDVIGGGSTPQAEQNK